jgi:hypothetical protein
MWLQSLMVLQLAEKYYGDKGTLRTRDERPSEGSPPEGYRTCGNGRKRAMDYHSNIISRVQHNLIYVELPKEKNFMDPVLIRNMHSLCRLAGKEPETK